jgi:acetamidase/formamidase
MGYDATTGIGPDLYEDAQKAVRYRIDWLVTEKRLSREDAYVLRSAVGDLKISEIVNQPNWIVSFYMPLSVFVKQVLPTRAPRALPIVCRFRCQLVRRGATHRAPT